MSKLLEQLRTLPAFNNFEKAVKEKLNDKNFYVQEFMPEAGTFEDYDDEGHIEHYRITRRQAEEDGIDNLVYDNTGYFSEFVREELGDDAYELIRELIKEIRK